MRGARPGIGSVQRETKLVIALVSGAEFINHTYLVLFPPILGILAVDFGVSLTLLGLAMGAQGLANTLFQLPFGYLSDHYDRKLSYGLSLGLGTLGTFVVAMAPSYAVLVAGQVLLGVGVAGHHPTHFPLLAEASPPGLRGRAFSTRAFAGNLGFATPPVVFTAVIGLGGLTWRHAVVLIGLLGATYTFVSLYGLSRYVDQAVTRGAIRRPSAANERPSVLGRAAAELRSLVDSPAILAMAVLAFLASMSGWGVTTFTVVLLTDGYGIGLDLANLTLTAMFLAGAVMVLVGGDLADRFSPGPLIIGAFASAGLLLFALGSLAIPAIAAVAVVVLIGGVRSLGGPARSKLADGFSARGSLGQSFAVITVGLMLGSSLAPPVFGALIETVELRVAFFGLATIALVAAAFTGGVLARYGDGRPTARSGSPGDDAG